ncbi:agmatine deiminase family protein [Telmatocola sphagniphila]|uniref:Agmatine deiminase family protein n=1 Tax=Telmatocola sphagniphila TaxID=1123043 RepID=A0A8E6B7M7_9BACT|nr:agmatine deiminase family protein [Telmatocola sphagniphila]QVL32984.1 agmatine deiminase family protein [Telmatocola sphagniphila]
MPLARTDTPAGLGYRMPAEWEPHAATWIAWPHQKSDWPGKIAPIPWVYTEIVRHLHQSEKVNLLVADSRMEAAARRYLLKGGVDLTKVHFWQQPTNRVWTRDYGPIFVVNDKHQKGMLDWRFNAWAKYPDWKQDDAIPGKLNKKLKLPAWQPFCHDKRVVLEGGSIDPNGKGMLLTTEECLLSPVQERNPGMNRADYEKVFHDYLGIKKVIWLNQGIVGDDTHGHVDDLARFVNAKSIVTIREPNAADPNHAILEENWDRLKYTKLDIIALPMPEPVVFNGQRLPASYANFYIANTVVLVPTFNDPNDREALGILAELFPDRKVVGIHAVDLVWGLGTLHCMTQQEPR